MNKEIYNSRDAIRARLEKYINIDENLDLRDELFTIADELQATQSKLDSLREYLKSDVKYRHEKISSMQSIFALAQDILNKLDEGKE